MGAALSGSHFPERGGHCTTSRTEAEKPGPHQGTVVPPSKGLDPVPSFLLEAGKTNNA